MDFLSYLNKAVTPYHTVLTARQMLDEAGFVMVDLGEPWDFRGQMASLAHGQAIGYYTVPSDGMLYAWVLREDYKAGQAFSLAACHTDYPCLHIKPTGEWNAKYSMLDVEVYGGPILNTWLDRPLGIAGRVIVKVEGKLQTRFVMSKRSVVTIPNLPIHFNREVNKGVELKKQIDLRPLAGTMMEEGWLLSYLAAECGVAANEVVDFDCFVYNTEEATRTGIRGDLLSSPRLDNQTSCYALLEGICHARRCGEKDFAVAALYDNEEIGNETKQGADSALFTMLLEKIYDALSYSPIRLKEAIVKSRLLSLDVAHALHSNHPEKFDVPNTAKLGDGVVLKLSSTQKYAYEPMAVAEACEICTANGIPMHRHVNHSDQPGGSTMGPVLSSWLPMPTLDLGVPIMAMHSAQELMCERDENALVEFVKKYLG